jgi:hypothetical protein
MADQVTIKPETNKVELTDQRRNITVTDNRTGASINLTQTDPAVLLVNTPGPQGSGGIATTSGSFSGSFQGDGSLLTGIVASGSIDSASVAISASFAETASYAVSASVEIIKELSSSFADTASFAQSGEGPFTGTFLATGHILADTDDAYDIGSPDRSFRDLYLSGSTIYLGGIKLSADSTGSLEIKDAVTNASKPIVVDNIILRDNVTGTAARLEFTGSKLVTVQQDNQGQDLAESAISALSGSFTGSYSGSVISTDFTFDGETLNVLGNVFVQGTLDAATKNFKIQHPTMPGYYLVHSSLEGPERGIYHRGKLKTSNTIFLPDYWKDLPVDDVDITVQLTPIGNACQHFVKSVSKEEIEIGCDCGKPHCFYIVHAQRYDQGKFEVLEPKQIKSL